MAYSVRRNKRIMFTAQWVASKQQGNAPPSRSGEVPNSPPLAYLQPLISPVPQLPGQPQVNSARIDSEYRPHFLPGAPPLILTAISNSWNLPRTIYWRSALVAWRLAGPDERPRCCCVDGSRVRHCHLTWNLQHQS